MDKRKKRSRLKLLGILLLSLIVLCILLVAFIQNNYSISIDNIDNKTISYGTKYEPNEPKVFLVGKYFGGKNIKLSSNYITIQDNVDDTNLGKYIVKYDVKYGLWEAHKEQLVTVIDDTKPTISLKGDNPIVLRPIDTFEEIGYVATDNIDGDISDLVKTKIEKDKVTYTVKDNAGNETSIIRNIIYDDKVAPEIKLNGETTIELFVGDEYKELGAIAIDDCDGDISSLIQIQTNGVNIGQVGEYNIHYKVKDSYGNESFIDRTIIVKERPIEDNQTQGDEQSGEPSQMSQSQEQQSIGEKVVYLTFDDGPGPHTSRLLDILDKYNVKATFFCVNGKYNNLIKEEYDRGHTVAIHSYTHNYKTIYSSDENYFEDLTKMQNVIYEQTGYSPVIFRFPGGSSNTVSKNYSLGIMSRLAKSTQDKGFYYFDWNVSSGDAGETTNTNRVYQNVTSGISSHKTSIVLQHDIKRFSVDAVESIIVWGLNNGYEFRPLSIDSPVCHHGINN